jgi:hypothetical protein
MKKSSKWAKCHESSKRTNREGRTSNHDDMNSIFSIKKKREGFSFWGEENKLREGNERDGRKIKYIKF